MTSLVFVGIAILGAGIIAVSAWLNWKWWSGLLAAFLVVVVAVLIFVIAENRVTLGPSKGILSTLKASPSREVILFGLLLLGMVARVVSLAIERRDALPAAANPRALRLDKWQFVYPLLFAIPTFGALLSQVDASTLSVAESVLAFQTGFFWQTILKREEQQTIVAGEQL